MVIDEIDKLAGNTQDAVGGGKRLASDAKGGSVSQSGNQPTSTPDRRTHGRAGGQLGELCLTRVRGVYGCAGEGVQRELLTLVEGCQVATRSAAAAGRAAGGQAVSGRVGVWWSGTARSRPITSSSSRPGPFTAWPPPTYCRR